jgi:hypothetical protein
MNDGEHKNSIEESNTKKSFYTPINEVEKLSKDKFSNYLLNKMNRNQSFQNKIGPVMYCGKVIEIILNF